MKILIIDDHILFAEGMKFLLGTIDEHLETLYAENTQDGLQLILDGGSPDLILLDINLSGANGFCLMEQLQELNIWTPVLVVSATNSSSMADIALANGASGFVSKASDSQVLIEAIKTVLNGDTYLPSVHASNNKYSDEDVSRVTSRQHEILHLLSQGLLNKQIASELSISTNTVKAHLHEIFRLLNVNNRTAAVQSAHKCGLL